MEDIGVTIYISRREWNLASGRGKDRLLVLRRKCVNLIIRMKRSVVRHSNTASKVILNELTRLS